MGNKLIELLYTSTATDLFQESDLKNIFEQSRINNTTAGITGMLIYCNRCFVRFEGEQSIIKELFKKIS